MGRMKSKKTIALRREKNPRTVKIERQMTDLAGASRGDTDDRDERAEREGDAVKRDLKTTMKKQIG